MSKIIKDMELNDLSSTRTSTKTAIQRLGVGFSVGSRRNLYGPEDSRATFYLNFVGKSAQNEVRTVFQWFLKRIRVNSLKKSLLTLMTLLSISGLVMAQKAEPQYGTISFVTSSSVYIRFDDTSTIQRGDTLYSIVADTFVPALIVDQKSSLSCVAKPLDKSKLAKGDVVRFKGRLKKQKVEKEKVEKVIVRKKDPIKGSASIATHVNASSATDFNTRNVARFRLSANEINDSRFSFDSYLLYRQNLERSESGMYRDAGLFNIYGFSVQYAKEGDYSVSVGRKVNRKVASLGMMDGIHAEKQLGSCHVGGILGFRPDQLTNEFNADLRQYGGYLGASSTKGKKRLEGTVGLLEQRNGSATDRRYLYMQGSASFGYGFSVFSSAEMDLYNLNAEMQETGSRLTNFHLSTNFRINKRIRLSASYDTRRQIIFYETFQTQLEQLIADDQARQGIRGRVNVKVTKAISAGFAYGKRYQNSMANASNNYNAFATIRNTPIIGGTLSGNINVNQSSYLNSISTTFRHNRYYMRNKVNASTYLRTVAYTYNPERETTVIQQFLGTNVNFRFGKNLTLGGLLELSLRKAEYKSRMNLQLTKRF